MKIKGILARDNTGWQDDFAEAVAQNGCGIMWKDQFSNMNEVVPLLSVVITEKGFFDYYNVANNVTNYRMKIVDFATKDTYDVKKDEWKQKNPAWFFDTFDEYSDGKQKAKIVFLVENVKKIESENSISIEKFKTYKDVQASRKNAVAYTKIMTRNELNMKQLVDTLTSNHNIILTGAPGTGKTYLAKQIAQQMVFGEVKEQMTDVEQTQFNEQCGFVQFHPSYDYTDFVEGLRPVQDDGGNVGFERKDGVFKEFCKKALLANSNIEDNDTIKQEFDSAWDKLLNEVRINLAIGKLTKIGIWDYGLSSVNSLKYTSTTAPSKYTFTINKNNVYDAYRGLQARPSGYFQKYIEDVVTYMNEKHGLKKYEMPQKKITDGKTPSYVFIIDEINRGEISKIFGELFFSIDPGYRGADGKVRTQYANMQTEPNEFDAVLKITDTNNCGHFFVPENVYIIGTMNDIDRSVESMDFAFRRRFAFIEIKAIDRIEMLYDSNNGIGNDNADEAKERMNRLNKEIEKIEGLSTAYHIGPAYFLKLKNYNGDFQQLWDNHLEGLLREYLRGMQNVDEKMETLKAAYNNESNPDN